MIEVHVCIRDGLLAVFDLADRLPNTNTRVLLHLLSGRDFLVGVFYMQNGAWVSRNPVHVFDDSRKAILDIIRQVLPSAVHVDHFHDLVVTISERDYIFAMLAAGSD